VSRAHVARLKISDRWHRISNRHHTSGLWNAQRMVTTPA